MKKMWKNFLGHVPAEPPRFYALDDENDHVDHAAGGNNGNGQTDNNNVALEKLENYCVALDDTIETGKRLIDVHKELTTLVQMRRELNIPPLINLDSNSEQLANAPVSEDNVPEELKCPVCFEIFGEGVFICVNGHSTCITCCEALRECPECRASYNDGKIRNRSVEKLMSSLKICCIHSRAGCDQQLTCAEMQIHVETCEFMNKPVRSPEYKELRKLSRAKNGESKRLEKRLQECITRLNEMKAAWWIVQEELRSSHDSEKVKTIEKAGKDFKVETMEVEMTVLYVKLHALNKWVY